MSQNMEIQYTQEEEERYLSVSSYFIEWNQSNADVFVINDISMEKNQMKELEDHAYHDPMTHLLNRLSGMRTLSRWVREKKKFCLIFADLDSLKYVNDVHGHEEGDRYIITAAKYLKMFSPNAVVCRIGGDEFMLLAPDVGYNEAYAIMDDMCNEIRNDKYLEGKDFSYSISFGIVAVDAVSILLESDILKLADERMYECKRARKMERHQSRSIHAGSPQKA